MPIKKVKKHTMVSAIVIAFAVALVWLVSRRDEQNDHDSQRRFLLQLAYRAKLNQKKDLVKELRQRCAQRRDAGLDPGEVLVALRPADSDSADVIWEVAYPSRDLLVQSAAGDETMSAPSNAIWQRQRLWQWHDGDGGKALDAKIRLSRNLYYPAKGSGAEVLSWRVHASSVRTKLGFRPGRIYRRLDDRASTAIEGGIDEPTVMWELVYREPADMAIEQRLVGTDEFQEVMAHMRTLLTRFESSLWRVATRMEPSR